MMTRPNYLKLAVGILFLSVAVKAVAAMLPLVDNRWDLLWQSFSGARAIPMLTMAAWSTVLPLFLIAMVWFRQNWARFVFVALVVLGVVTFLFFGLKRHTLDWAGASAMLLDAAGIGFLFASSTSAWFKKAP